MPHVYVCSFNPGAGVVFGLSTSVGIKPSTNGISALHKGNKIQQNCHESSTFMKKNSWKKAKDTKIKKLYVKQVVMALEILQKILTWEVKAKILCKKTNLHYTLRY